MNNFGKCFNIIKECVKRQQLINVQLIPSYQHLTPKEKKFIDALYIQLKSQNIPWYNGAPLLQSNKNVL